MNRRSFFAALVNPPSSAEAGSGAMTVRTGGHGERISLLGYGAMRYPTVDGSHANAHRGGSNAPIDTELVQRQIVLAVAFFRGVGVVFLRRKIARDPAHEGPQRARPVGRDSVPDPEICIVDIDLGMAVDEAGPQPLSEGSPSSR